MYTDPVPAHETTTSARHLGRTLRRYVAQEMALPTALALGGLTALVLTKDLLGFSDLVINRGFSAADVAWIAFYELIPLIAYTLPFAVLVGVLVGLGRLRGDLEIVAIAAGGVSSRRLIDPVLLFTAALAGVGLFFTLFAAPWAARSLDAALQRMILANPGVALRSGAVQEFGELRVVAREVSARGDDLHGVLLWIPDLGQTIFAERGELTPLPDGSLRLVLHEVQALLAPRKGGGETHFETFTMTLPANVPLPQREKETLAGAPSGQLFDLTRSPAIDPDERRRAGMEWHRRLAYPLASMVFGVLGVALAITGSRFSRAAGAVVGLLMTAVYYGLVQLGNGLTRAGVGGVGFGAWLPNVVVGVLAVLLFWRDHWQLRWNWKARRPHGAAISPSSSTPPPTSLPRYVLHRYVAGQYLQALGIAFAVLLVGYLLIDVLERLRWFARHQADALEVLSFYGARIPLLASRVTPMALLLATAMTVSWLSAHREIVAMRACGVSAVSALASIVYVAGVATPGYFILNEIIVPQTNALADQLKEVEIKHRGPESQIERLLIWYRAGTSVYQAVQLDPQRGEAQELSIYELGTNGLPVSRTDARVAKYLGKGMWELVDPVRTEISAQGLRTVPAESRVQLGDVPEGNVDPMHMNVRQLARQIAETELAGYDATTFRVDWHTRMAAPLACLLLPAVALFFAIGGPPFPGPAVTLLVSGVLGVGYILLTGVSASLGYGGVLPPSLAGWGPALSLALLAGGLALRSRG